MSRDPAVFSSSVPTWYKRVLSHVWSRPPGIVSVAEIPPQWLVALQASVIDYFWSFPWRIVNPRGVAACIYNLAKDPLTEYA